ncbi:MAG: TetR/AcrR family transcriptional regulator [Nocardioidaceae bacterium]|nr:TetR/AcrR family transcriptional regulator [Nocardioidaceae bacterium]MCL2612564.1 TetR/AcrR family transcriptional regulator [Nocardioidaceae bacterium]
MSTYHHGNLREALVEVAVEIGREKGPDGIVLREVARRTGVSHNAAYRHFADRGALLQAVAAVALEEMGAAIQARLRNVRGKDPADRARRRLRANGQAYVEYALAEPGLFQVAFNNVSLEELSGPYDMLAAALDECRDTGWMAPEKRAGAELVCWSAAHGFAMLYGTGPLRGAPPAARRADLARLLDRIEDGYRA